MAYVITEPCIGTCDTACVKICPVDCIPNDPQHVESHDELQAKFQRLSGLGGNAGGLPAAGAGASGLARSAGAALGVYADAHAGR